MKALGGKQSSVSLYYSTCLSQTSAEKFSCVCSNPSDAGRSWDHDGLARLVEDLACQRLTDVIHDLGREGLTVVVGGVVAGGVEALLAEVDVDHRAEYTVDVRASVVQDLLGLGHSDAAGVPAVRVVAEGCEDDGTGEVTEVDELARCHDALSPTTFSQKLQIWGWLTSCC